MLDLNHNPQINRQLHYHLGNWAHQWATLQLVIHIQTQTNRCTHTDRQTDTYTHTDIDTHLHRQTDKHTQIDTQIHTHIQTHTRTYTQTHAHRRRHMHTHTHTCAHVHIYYKWILTHTCAHTYIYIHQQLRTRKCFWLHPFLEFGSLKSSVSTTFKVL